MIMNYIFAQIYRQTKKVTDVPIFASISIISMIYVSILFILIEILNKFTNNYFRGNTISPNQNYLILASILLFSYLRYGRKSRREMLEKKYENVSNAFPLWIIVISPLLLFILGIVVMAL